MKNLETESTDNENKEYYDRLRNSLMQHKAKEEGFLLAWKQAVKYIGEQLFTNHKDVQRAATVDEAVEKRQLIPCRKSIDNYLSYASTGEKLFMAVIYTFYNGYQGDIFCRELRYSSVGDIACRLSAEEIELVSELMKNHTGW